MNELIALMKDPRDGHAIQWQMACVLMYKILGSISGS